MSRRAEDLEVGDVTVFDVRGEKVGRITAVFYVDGVRYYSIESKPSTGFVETHQRVGMARVYPNFPISHGDKQRAQFYR